MRYLISADYHLDENKRFQDYIKNMLELEVASVKHKPDVFVHGGDVFNKRKPTPKELKEFALHLTRIQARKVLIVKGNHDKIDEHLSTLDWIQTLKVKIKNVFRIKDGRYSIYIAHRTVTEAKLGPKEVHLKDISYKKLPGDIKILGHIHKPQIINPKEFTDGDVKKNPLVFYPGSIERVNFGECGESKYYWIMDVKPKSVQLTMYPFNLRPMYYIIYNLDDKSILINNSEVVEIKEDIIRNSILKIKFIGKKDTIRKINYDKLLEKFKESYSVSYSFEFTETTSLVKTSKIKKVSDKDILKSYCKEYQVKEVVKKIAEDILNE